MNAVNSLCCSSPKSRMMATAEMASSVMNRRADARYFMRVWCLWVKTEGRRCSAVVKTVVKLLILSADRLPMLLPSVRTLISLRVCGKFRWLTAVVRVVSSALLIF